MAKKLLDFQGVLKEELKDKEFKKFYEEEEARFWDTHSPLDYPGEFTQSERVV